MPRKTWEELEEAGVRPEASMRPRPDAAENPPRGRCTCGRREASMRPRPDAAENAGFRGPEPEKEGASMRPRPDAAENVADRLLAAAEAALQ